MRIRNSIIHMVNLQYSF